MSNFDRIKPPPARSVPPAPSGAPAPSGPSARPAQLRPSVPSGPSAPSGAPQGPRTPALFSAAAAAPGGLPTLRVHCAGCGGTAPVGGVRQALRALLPIALFVPWRRHPVFAVCPACQRRQWLRPVLGPGGERPGTGSSG